MIQSVSEDVLHNISISDDSPAMSRVSSIDRPRISSATSIPPSSVATVAYLTLLVLGIGNLLPWNAFITAESYYSSRLCKSTYGKSFENYFNLGFSLAQPVGSIVSLFYGHALSMQNQIRYPLIVLASVFTVITVTVAFEINALILFWSTLVFTFFCGFCSALMNGGLFGLAGVLPSQYTSALMTGSSIAGLLVSLSSLITQAAAIDPDQCLGDDTNAGNNDCEDTFHIDFSAMAYFIVATTVIYACIICFEAFVRSSFLQYYMKQLMLKAYEGDCDDPNMALISINDLSMSFKDSSLKAILRSRASLMALSYHSKGDYISNVLADSRHHQSSLYAPNYGLSCNTYHKDSSSNQSQAYTSKGNSMQSKGHEQVGQEQGYWPPLMPGYSDPGSGFNSPVDYKSRKVAESLKEAILSQPPSPSPPSSDRRSGYNPESHVVIDESHSPLLAPLLLTEAPCLQSATQGDVSVEEGGVGEAEEGRGLPNQPVDKLNTHSLHYSSQRTTNPTTLTGNTSQLLRDHEFSTFAAEQAGGVGKDDKQMSMTEVLSTARAVCIPGFSVFINFTISLAVYPAVIVSIGPTDSCPHERGHRVFNELWVPILFVIWGLFDFIGRYSAEKTKNVTIITPTNIWIFATARVVIAVLLMLCNIDGSRLPRLFLFDAVPLLLVAFHAFTSGYIANLSMMFGPELVSSDKSPLAGTIMVVALTFGLVTGALVSFLLVFILKGNVFG